MMLHRLNTPGRVSPGPIPQQRSYPDQSCRMLLHHRTSAGHGVKRTRLLVSTAVQNDDSGGETKLDADPRPRIKHQSSFNDWSKTYINEKGILVCSVPAPLRILM